MWLIKAWIQPLFVSKYCHNAYDNTIMSKIINIGGIMSSRNCKVSVMKLEQNVELCVMCSVVYSDVTATFSLCTLSQYVESILYFWNPFEDHINRIIIIAQLNKIENKILVLGNLTFKKDIILLQLN